MAAGGGPRAWQFLKRNDGYAEARPPFAGAAPSFLDAPFPLRRQTGAGFARHDAVSTLGPL